MSLRLPTPADAVAGWERLSPVLPAPRLAPAPALSALLGAEIRVQRGEAGPLGGGAIARAAANAALCASPGALTQDLIACGVGPFGQAVAAMAGRLRVRASLVLEEDDPAPAPERARILRVSGGPAALRDEAARRARAEGLRWIDPAAAEAMAGGATAAIALLRDWPEVEAVIAPAVSGATCAGLALGLRGARSAARLVAATPQAAPSLRLSLAAAAAQHAPPLPDAPLRGAVTPEAPAAFLILSRCMNSLVEIDGPALAAALVAAQETPAPPLSTGGRLALAALLSQGAAGFGARIALVDPA